MTFQVQSYTVSGARLYFGRSELDEVRCQIRNEKARVKTKWDFAHNLLVGMRQDQSKEARSYWTQEMKSSLR